MFFRKRSYELIKVAKEYTDVINYSNGEVIRTELRYKLIFERINSPLNIKVVYKNEDEFCEDRYKEGLVVNM